MKKIAPEPLGAALATPHAVEGQGTAKNARYARFFWPVFRWMASLVAVCASVPFLAGLLFQAYADRWKAAGIVYSLASFTLIAILPRKGAPLVTGGRLPPWSLLTYLAILGLELNWACAFFWFSRRHAFFSLPVIGVTGLIIAFYAAIALVVARLTGGNWRIALATFGLALIVPAVIVLRLGLLW